MRVAGAITCLGCHSSYIDGQLIFGLGNTFSDYTGDQATNLFSVVDALISRDFGEESPEAEAYLEFKRGSARVAPYTKAPFMGLNPAFRIEDAAASMRDPETFAWLEEPLFEVPNDGITSDVPPWWNVKKKAALYYNGMGRGDFPKMMMQTSVVAIASADQAREIHSHFDDLLAFIFSLGPRLIHNDLSTTSQKLAERRPLLNSALVAMAPTAMTPRRDLSQHVNSIDIVGTTHYLDMRMNDPLSRWLNRGWYASDEAEGGDTLLAFPLLGYRPTTRWDLGDCTYLHNGSFQRSLRSLTAKLV